jgi:site-specific DNA-adenine methylase
MRVYPLIKCHGGKHYLAKRIASVIEPFLQQDGYVYCEPFLGGGSVLTELMANKYMRTRRVHFIAEKDDGIWSAWISLIQQYQDFEQILSCFDYSEWSFRQGLRMMQSKSQVCVGVGTVIAHRMSRGGLCKEFSSSSRLRGGINEGENSWKNFIEKSLPELRNRFIGFEYSGPAFYKDGVDALREFPRESSYSPVVYADPPYLKSTRTAKNAYRHDSDHNDHVELLRVLTSFPGIVFLSGYRSKLYDDSLTCWQRVDIEMPNNSGQGKTKQRRVESLWCNRIGALDSLVAPKIDCYV